MPRAPVLQAQEHASGPACQAATPAPGRQSFGRLRTASLPAAPSDPPNLRASRARVASSTHALLLTTTSASNAPLGLHMAVTPIASAILPSLEPSH